MNLKPSSKDSWTIQGRVNLEISDATYGIVQDEFVLKIIVPKTFPNDIPVVFELEDRFPKTVDYHIYVDGSLCLGSPLSIRKRIADNPTISGFVETCIVPFLFSMSLYLKGTKTFVFGELSHGTSGILEDYCQIFDLETFPQVLNLIDILCMKKNIANKQICPCGCNQIITKCKVHKKIVEYRKVMSRKDFESDKADIVKLMEQVIQYRQHKRIPLV